MEGQKDGVGPNFLVHNFSGIWGPNFFGTKNFLIRFFGVLFLGVQNFMGSENFLGVHNFLGYKNFLGSKIVLLGSKFFWGPKISRANIF